MKQMRLKFGLMTIALMALTIGIHSCKKDKTTPKGNGPITVFDNSEMTNATFLGRVIKEDGSPLEGAQVKTGTHFYTTDEDGFFFFTDINTPLNATLIEVEETGYFTAYRTVKVIPNQDNVVKIMMMKVPAAATFDAAIGGKVAVTNGGSIEFAPTSIVNELTETPYTGQVNVYAKWIDPSSADLPYLMPGDLRGINALGEENALVTYGMQVVELRGSGGEKLQLAPGATATLNFKIPSVMQGSVPDEVPLWYFDEAKGMWVEEGSATSNGIEFSGKVSHFSYWNCDYGGPVVNFTATFVDQNNSPLSGALIKLVPQSSPLAGRIAYTNSSGTVSGSIPVNMTFDIEYLPVGCVNNNIPFMFIQTFSSVNSNVNLGTIPINTTSIQNTIVNGSVTDCNNAILPNAPVKFVLGAAVFMGTSDAAGNFAFYLSCINGTQSANIRAYDVNNSLNGDINVNITGGTTNNVGVVQACGAQNDFITWSITNVPSGPYNYTIVEPNATFYQYFQGGTTGIYGYETTTNLNFSFDGPQTVAGVHNLLSFSDNTDTVTISGGTVNLTQYQSVGGKIEGSFNTTALSGTVYNGGNISCQFRVTRTQ